MNVYMNFFFYFFSVHVLLYLYNFGGVSARLQGSNSLECFLNALLGTCLNYNILLEKLIDLQQHLVIHRHSCKLKHFKYLNWNSRVGLLSPDVSQQTQTGLELDGLSWALIWTFLIPRAVFSDPSLCRASLRWTRRLLFVWSVSCDDDLTLYLNISRLNVIENSLSQLTDELTLVSSSSLLLSSSPSVPLCRWWRLPGWRSVSEQGPRGHGPGPGGHQEAAAVPHGTAGQPQQGHVQ